MNSPTRISSRQNSDLATISDITAHRDRFGTSRAHGSSQPRSQVDERPSLARPVIFSSLTWLAGWSPSLHSHFVVDGCSSAGPGQGSLTKDDRHKRTSRLLSLSCRAYSPLGCSPRRQMARRRSEGVCSAGGLYGILHDTHTAFVSRGPCAATAIRHRRPTRMPIAAQPCGGVTTGWLAGWPRNEWRAVSSVPE